MSRKDDGGPAFPTTSEDYQQGFEGMSLRDYFAGQALQGWLSGPCQGDALDDYRPDDTEPFAQHQAAVARACYGYADAMLRERAR
jgi:hypothetical protein